MEWLYQLFFVHSAVQAVVVISLLCAAGLALGRIKILGISLGVTFVFFVGILAGALGLSISSDVLSYAQDFGLVVFVYALGVQVGPGFFSSLHHSGLHLTLSGIAVLLVGTIATILIPLCTGVSLPDSVGILCGASTNTPALAAAQQTLQQLHLPTGSVALACAVTYPFGVVGVILAIAIMKRWLVSQADVEHPKHVETDDTYIASYHVRNPGICGKSIGDVAKLTNKQFVISRLWRAGKVSVPDVETILQPDDKVLVVSHQSAVETLQALIGPRDHKDWNKSDLNWNKVDRHLVSRSILVTKSQYNGRLLSSLKLRSHYGVNISRILRNGVPLLATPNLRLLLGDRLIVVGERQAVRNIGMALGNTYKALNEPNLITMFIGMVIGLIVGSVPLAMPGISVPVKLGLAGGPIIVGILIGAFGPRFHVNSYTTESANRLMRQSGLALYLACLGLASGPGFVATIMRPEGVVWIAAGMLLTLIPVLVMGIVAYKALKMDFREVCGMLCGAMANPMALDYSTDTLHSDAPTVAYATVYPMSMFARVVLVQLILIFGV